MMSASPSRVALLPALAILTVLGAVTLAPRVWSAVTRVVAAASGSAIDRVAVRDHGPPDEPSPESPRDRTRPWVPDVTEEPKGARATGGPVGEDARVDQSFRRVGSRAEVPEGELRSFDLPGLRVAIAHVENELYAFGDECTHEGCSLAEGTLGEQEDTVVCPCQERVRPRDGRARGGAAIDPVPVFAVA